VLAFGSLNVGRQCLDAAHEPLLAF